MDYLGLIAVKLTPSPRVGGTTLLSWLAPGSRGRCNEIGIRVQRSGSRNKGQKRKKWGENGYVMERNAEEGEKRVGNTLCSDGLSEFSEFIRLSSRGLLRKSMRLCGACVYTPMSPLAGPALAFACRRYSIVKPVLPGICPRQGHTGLAVSPPGL